MLFMYIHKHPVEKCMAEKLDEARQMYTKFLEGAAKAGVKPVATYTAGHEHTIFVIMEANDIAALEQLLTPMTVWGDARLIPIMQFGAAP
jgi:hypothetical protein